MRSKKQHVFLFTQIGVFNCSSVEICNNKETEGGARIGAPKSALEQTSENKLVPVLFILAINWY